MLNTNKVLKSKLNNDKDLILLLDALSEEEISPTKSVYIRIRKFIKQILNERRGLIDENKVHHIYYLLCRISTCVINNSISFDIIIIIRVIHINIGIQI